MSVMFRGHVTIAILDYSGLTGVTSEEPPPTVRAMN